VFRSVPSVWDAIREASGRRLQLNLELGDGWAVGRIGGELPASARNTLERICHLLLEANDDFEFDVTGVPGFDPSGMIGPTPAKLRVVFDNAPRPTKAKAKGSAA
jgi:hypothetical protein